MRIKGYLRLISLMLSLVFVFSLVSCGADKSEDEGPAESDTLNEQTGETDGFSIFKNGEYSVRVIMPERATELEKSIYDKIRTKLREVTGVMPERMTDFKPYNDDGEARKGPAILIGNTNYEESAEVYSTLRYSESKLKTVGNKLVCVFSSELDAEAAFVAFVSYFRNVDKENVVISDKIDFSRVSNEFLASIPKYDENKCDLIDLDRETYMINAKGASIEDMNAYCDILRERGFNDSVSREAQGNIFKTLVSSDKYAYAYYRAFDSSLRVVIGTKNSLAEQSYSSGLEETYTPYIASVPQPNDGLGYIIRLPDGRFIIFDGGYTGDDRVYSTLRQLEEDKITVAAWFISHPHGDHYPALMDFAKDHGNDEKIVIERIMLNYAHPDMYDINGSAGEDLSGSDVKELYVALQQYLPNTPVIKVHTGQNISFGSSSVEILYTVEDLMGQKITNINDTSMVIRVNIGEQSIMLLADTCYASGPILNSTWGEMLKSDIMQIAHHGCWPSVKEIYDSIQAEVVLFPAMMRNFKNYVVEEKWAEVMNTALGYAKDVYVSGDAMEIIELPYVIKNNKEEVLEYAANYGES
ncbi:MAG: MBL fold metallo-hydrolase [Clostridia bacterium]|nr:MBL fold metallo-hydrolase [Clostridia bacterium]